MFRVPDGGRIPHSVYAMWGWCGVWRLPPQTAATASGAPYFMMYRCPVCRGEVTDTVKLFLVSVCRGEVTDTVKLFLVLR